MSRGSGGGVFLSPSSRRTASIFLQYLACGDLSHETPLAAAVFARSRSIAVSNGLGYSHSNTYDAVILVPAKSRQM